MLASGYENPYENGYGRNPYAALIAGSGGLRAQPNGLFLVRFAWADTGAGLATNVWESGLQLGFALQTFNAWNCQRVQRKYGAPLLLPGLPCVLARTGDFVTLFADGATAGSQVYANPVTGQASISPVGPVPLLDSSGDYVLDSYGNVIVTQGVSYIPTPWTVMQNTTCGCPARISSWVKPVGGTYLRDSSGNLVLDSSGNPILTR